MAPPITDPVCEYLYGEWLRVDCETGATPMPCRNPDVIILLAQARASGSALAGPPPTEILPAVSSGRVRQALIQSLDGLMQSLEGDERNVLLTLARIAQTLDTGLFAPKDQAATWAIPRLGNETGEVMVYARSAYLAFLKDRWDDRRRASREAAEEICRMLIAPHERR